jgi:hypothetical protein
MSGMGSFRGSVQQAKWANDLDVSVERSAEELPGHAAVHHRAVGPATGAQPYEPGNIVALSFADPDEEAQYIVATAQALRGVAFREEGEAGPGLVGCGSPLA